MSPSLPIARRFLPLSALFAVLLSGPASASPNAVHRVPEDFPNIQAAVDAANAGDEISVRAGSWCGATITKQVTARLAHAGDGGHAASPPRPAPRCPPRSA